MRDLFPEVFEEGKINFDKLQVVLGENIDKSNEKYEFSWNGKFEAMKLAQLQSTGTLIPCKEKSKDWDTTQNLYIEGDNLEVLKLLQKSYVNQIKMIYIDPPYNTGNDFVYKDNFADNIANYKEITGQATKSNVESSGRYHTNWLNMMYPRLKLARNLLKSEGIIFISIDHNELNNLIKICDEIFGETNRLGIISTVNNLKGRSDDNFFATCNEFLLVYAKNRAVANINGFKLEDEELENDYDKQDEISFYKLIGFRKTGTGWERHNRPFMFYPVLYKDDEFSTIPDAEFSLIYNVKTNTFDENFISLITTKYTNAGYNVIWPTNENGDYGRWRWGRETFYEQKDYNLEINNAGTLCTKMRATLEDGSIRVKTAKTLWYKPEYDTGSSAKILKNLFQNSSDIFDNPKSPIYIKDMLKIITKDNDIILDFFSGSATTAHAVMQLNAEDGGNRKYILVQLPEVTEDDSEARKAGFETICDIGEERIRRAGQKISDENQLLAETKDFGFKVFKLDTSNLVKWNNTPTEDVEELKKRLQQNLFYIVDGRSNMDLVYEIMLKYGLPLTLPINEKKYGDYKAYEIASDTYKVMICLDRNLPIEIIEQMTDESVGTYVFADHCFGDANILINTEEILKKKSKNLRIF